MKTWIEIRRILSKEKDLEIRKEFYSKVLNEYRNLLRESSVSREYGLTYTIARIPKSNGMTRVLEVPNSILKSIQREMLKDLTKIFTLHPKALASTGHSFVDNAKPHLGSKHLFKTDIKDFYHSIRPDKLLSIVEKYFTKELFWIESVSKLLFYSEKARNGKIIHCIPTGAPTSPFIANLVLLHLDNLIDEYCNTNNLIYTRYLDDITISSTKDLSIEECNKIAKSIIKLVNQDGWKISSHKTKWINPKHDCLDVTGVDIRNGQKVNNQYIKSKIRPLINKEVFTSPNYWSIRGLHKKHSSNINSFKDLLPVIFTDTLPYLSYVKQVNTDQYNQLLSYIEERFNKKTANDISLKDYFINTTITLGNRILGIRHTELVGTFKEEASNFFHLNYNKITNASSAVIYALKYILDIKDDKKNYSKLLEEIDELPF